VTVAIAYGDSLTAQVWPDIQAWPSRYGTRLAGETRPECAPPDGLHLSAWGQVVIADTLPLTLEAGRG